MSKLSLKAADETTDVQAAAPSAIRMETCSCLVRLGGDVRNEVPVSNVTPAELILLRAIHGGAETVHSARVDGESPLSATGERMRLMAKYPRYHRALTEMFPGLAPQYPRTLQEAEEMAAQELSQQETEAADPLEG